MKNLGILTLSVLGLATSIMIAGCGGSSPSSGSSSQQSRIKFNVKWSARSRAIAAPSSALSVVVTLTGAGASNTDVTTEADRLSNPATYSQNYTSAVTVKPGTYPLTVNFYDQTGGTGDVVATGNANVKILSDGSGIGTVSVTNRITSVTVLPGQIAFTPQSQTLLFSAKDAQGDIIAVSPGSGIWSQVDGTSFMTLASDGTAVGLQRGNSNVKVTVDSVTSAPIPVEVTADPNGTSIVLNFDSLPATPTQNTGTPVPAADQLSTLYLTSDGISFSSLAPYVAVANMTFNTAPSLPNCICGVTADGFIQYGQATPVNFTFSDPLNPSAPGVTKSFSVTGDLDGNSANVVEIDAYDVSGNLVGIARAADVGGEVLSITLAKPTIHKVVFLSSPSTSDGVALDNVTFGPVVPLAP